MIKVLKQTAKLGIFLEIVFADAIAENQVSFVKPAAPTKLARSQ